MSYHARMHCIVYDGSLPPPDHKIRKTKDSFFIPVKMLRDKFKGKYLSALDSLYESEQLVFSSSCDRLHNSYDWAEFHNALYAKDWLPCIKETFNGFGNAIEYLRKYIHKIALSNSRILSVDEQQVSFSAGGQESR